MILTAKMMLDWLGESAMADRLEQAVCEVISERKVGTYDVGLDNTSLEVAEAIAEKL
jgi:isocitrate/isopropylmalate dehydrogenase